MNWKFAVRNISLLLIFIFVTACSNAKATATSASVATEPLLSTPAPGGTELAGTAEIPTATEGVATEASTTSGSGMPVAGEGQCANAYYPVREGATWAYSSSGGPAGGYSFTDTITSVRQDGFTLTTQFNELTRTQEWGCSPEGLVALQLGGTSAVALNNDNMQVSFDVNNVSGVTFPAQIQPGNTWQHALEFTAKMTVAGQGMDASGDAKSSFQAMDYESVTVPAGTFDALKIHIDTTININGNFNGVNFPVTVSSPYDYWFVQGVGWVKAVGTGNVSGQSFSETIELQSYNIP
jgi:hypothetical protein